MRSRVELYSGAFVWVSHITNVGTKCRNVKMMFSTLSGEALDTATILETL